MSIKSEPFTKQIGSAHIERTHDGGEKSHTHYSMTAQEALILATALQTAASHAMKNDQRGSEREIRIWHKEYQGSVGVQIDIMPDDV